MGFVALFYPWGIILQAMALLHFVRRRPDTFWLWIILMGGGLGALVYIVEEVVPDTSLSSGPLKALGLLAHANAHAGNTERAEMLFQQATALGLASRWEQVCRTYADVNQLFGDIVKVTPTSKAVGDMALFLVANNLQAADVLDPAR